MKKFLIPFLLLALVLTGCAVQNEMDSASTPETAPPGLYVSGSDIEQQTGGAVRLYALQESDYCWLSAIGDQLLLASNNEPSVLTILTGADCIPTAKLPIDPDLLSSGYKALYNGFVYYDQAENQAIFLDPQLQEVNRISLPERIQGQPWFSPDGSEIFYCVDKELRAMDVELKLSKLVKAHSYDTMAIIDGYFDGTILACKVSDDKDGENTLYISAENGQTLQTENGITALYTYEDKYIALRTAGIVEQRIYGIRGNAAQHLDLDESSLADALQLGGVVGYRVQDGKLTLSFYDLTSGKKTSVVSLDGAAQVKSILADRWSGCVWILAEDKLGSDILLRWDRKISATQDEKVYLSTLYTAASPDKAGLKACEDRVSAMNKEYGVRVRIWEEAVKYPSKYKMVAEHHSQAIHTVLDQLEPVLKEFPKKFLQNAIASRVRICIVRSVDGKLQSVQYWDENDAYIVLSAGVDVRNAFIEGLSYIVDSHVLGNSAKYDKWNELNPAGFVYGTPDEKYLSGDTRAFADAVSMKSAVDDRSHILYEAMKPDNASIFASETMQKKLLLVCQGIRDAWGLKNKTDVYLWEQYLTQPIAKEK